jgi:Protein of unknown function (DUF4038)
MCLQPDMRAAGPVGRNVDDGFAVAFDDLPEGRLTRINFEYFQYLDRIVDVLIDHGITPIWQPVFHGYGWKGLDTAGAVVPSGEYARYCRYLVARFGARPAIYLPGADGAGTEPQIEAGGRDPRVGRVPATHRPSLPAAFAQQRPPGYRLARLPGLPDRPHRRPRPGPARHHVGGPADQGDHERGTQLRAHRAARRCRGLVAGARGLVQPLCRGAHWVAYGAASLWQWRIHRGEPGHGAYFLGPDAGWREALTYEGSRYVGLVGKILDDLPLAHASPCWDVSTNTRGLLDPGVLYVGYAEHGGPWLFLDAQGRVPGRYWMIDPRTGEVIRSGDRPPDGVPIEADRPGPYVLICSDTTPTGIA